MLWTLGLDPDQPFASTDCSVIFLRPCSVGPQNCHALPTSLVSASTVDKEMREKVKGMKKSEQAKLVGQAIAERAKGKGIQTVVFDRGGFRYVGRVKALADGAREGGLQF